MVYKIIEVIKKALGNSDELIPLYQVGSFFYEQKLLLDVYDDLPIYFSMDSFKSDIFYKINSLKDQLNSYKDGEFSITVNTMYEMIQNMMKYL